jgi:hypothetical protein
MALINPPAALLGHANAIVGGRSRRYAVAGFVGPLSIKAVISGTATGETRDGRYPLGPSGCLVLHEGDEYSIEVDALHPVETFCIHGNLESPLVVSEIAWTACLSTTTLAAR